MENYIEDIYRRHSDMVFRLSFMYLKSEADAYDAVQDIFLKVMKKGIEKEYFKSDEHEKAWLILTCQNYCKDQLRKFWRRKRINIDEIKELADKNNTDTELLKSVLALPKKYKTIIYMHYFEGYAISEIANYMQENASTLRSRMAKARALLKIELNMQKKEEVYEQR